MVSNGSASPNDERPVVLEASSESSAVPNETAAPSPSGKQQAQCTNCGAPLHGPYCAECGQKADHHLHPMRRLLHEMLDEVLEFDFRIGRTLRHLALPGVLSRAHLGGRRAGYIRPFRLFLLASVVMILAFSAGRWYVQQYTTATGEIVKIQIDDDAAVDVRARIDSLRQTEATWQVVRATVLERVLERRDDTASVNQFYFEWLTLPLAIMVPLFALLLKGAYRRHLYAEHVVVSLHLHSASFLLVTGWIGLIIAYHAWIGAGRGMATLAVTAGLLWVGYGLVSLRRIYGGSWRWALGKGSVLAFFYVVLLSAMIGLYGLLSVVLA